MLDLCAGTGSFTVAFASKAAFVTAVEPASAMINFLRQRVARQGCDNVRIIQAPWEDVDVDAEGLAGCFDLVAASSCPGVHNVKLLQKALRCANKYFYYYGWADKRQNDALDALWNHLYNCSPPVWPGDSIYVLNWLYAQGYDISVEVREAQQERESSIQDAADSLLFSLDIFGKDVSGLRQEVEKFVVSRAVNGKLSQTTVSRRVRILVTLSCSDS